jgi:5-oxoprolinase (ATP-hydrolysing)
LRSVAIVLMHGYRYPEHERQLAELAREAGYTQVSVSHRVSPIMKLVCRGDTTVADAYLSPVLRRHVGQVSSELGQARLLFMQSNGGLVPAQDFQGKDSILSGPAAGVVGMARTAESAGFAKVIGFDMGGTSTDVSHYAGEYERALQTQVAGIRLSVPMMQIHTVAAGGGSILYFDGSRLRVGPDSAGANPGPACYRLGGPLTVTDCNVMLGKLQPEFFPTTFGPDANQTIDQEAAHTQFQAMADAINAATGGNRSAFEIAEGFLGVAVENMANAIRKISVQRGYDVREYALGCFGSAAGQHACAVADALGMSTVLIHPFAGVLSAYGMGLADLRTIRQQTLEKPLSVGLVAELEGFCAELAKDGIASLSSQGVEEVVSVQKVYLRYEGSDSPLAVSFGNLDAMITEFANLHRQIYGFIDPCKALIVESVTVEVVGQTEPPTDPLLPARPPAHPLQAVAHVDVHTLGETRLTPVYSRDALYAGDRIDGPALIVETNGTVVVEPHWRCEVTALGDLLLRRDRQGSTGKKVGAAADPALLEIFNNLFMSIAEQMGAILEKTAHSVNIKERLDFSCAVFDGAGRLVANAPHIPVHLGSMGESVRAVIRGHESGIRQGDVFATNSPYNGGTHLPDITVVTPIFLGPQQEASFWVASRGHHADIGGITPGSMPPDSKSIAEEGVLIDNFLLVDSGVFQERALRGLLASSPHPARRPGQNVADLKAQIAANEKGAQELRNMAGRFGEEAVLAYMGHVQDNAEESVRRLLETLDGGEFECAMDQGCKIRVRITVDRNRRSAVVDFTGTSPQQPGNFNAPAAVCRAAVMYVFRTLVNDDIPMNEGFLKPLTLVIPEGSMLNPRPPAAVVAGNVETSQIVTDCLYGALGKLAASQGTMNNFTFGNARHQYYETIAGGSGAGPDFDGADAVQTHMTNSRLTDPEVLEWRFPVLVENFAIRKGSGGAGLHRGGDGVVRRIRFLEPMTAAILSNRRRVEPFGLAGGQAGCCGRNIIERHGGGQEALGSTARVEMDAGDVFVMETPGGGGMGVMP